MTVKSKVLAGAATLTLVCGAGLAGAGTASAATPSCGNSCVNTYPQEYAGQSNSAPQFVLDVFQRKVAAAQPVILFRSSNADPAEDWTYADQGPLSSFYAAGLVSSEVALHYGCSGTVAVAGAQIPCAANAQDDTAYELEYAPYGVDSGLCMGLAATAVSGEGVTLQPCGTTARTVWIQDTFSSDDSPSTAGGTYWAGINGSDTNFSNPFVLTYPGSAYPTDKPRAQLTVTNLAQFSQGSSPDDSNQLWTAFPGDLP
jgi:hypothetical protein